MPSQEKLIKQGIKYTDSLFAEISKRIEQGVLSTDTLEAFLEKYHKAYPDNGNPLVTLGYDKEMIKLILSETNNHKFTRPAQKELVRVTIENRVGDNIVDVGDEIRDSVRDIVKDGYNNRLSQDEIAENISSKVTGIKNRRARAIARTEIARAATISDYIINKEMGATHFYVECRNTACPVCKEAWHNKWTPENDSSFNPSDTSAGGKGWIGDKTYSMSDTKMLPPIHPNCRCVPYFISDGSIPENNVKVPRTNSGNDSNESLLEQHVSTRTANNNLLRGEPEIYDDVDDEGEHLTVYKFNNIELAFNDNTRITYDELKRHIDSLPKAFENTYAERIIIHDYRHPRCGGVWKPNEKELHVYNSRKSQEGLFNVFNHEFAHSIDMPRQKGIDWEYTFSHPDNYETLFWEDNKLGYSEYGVVKPEVPIKFVTSYAGRSYLKFSNNERTPERMYSEDFAEASAHYLNPNQHEEFCKEFPNRAKYLESIYGKPDFTNSGIKPVETLSKDEIELRSRDIEFKSISKNDVVEFYRGGVKIQRKLIDQQRDTLREEIESLKEERKRVRRTRRECETEECEEKVRLKVSEMRIQIQRMEKTDDELFKKWISAFDSVNELDGLLTP